MNFRKLQFQGLYYNQLYHPRTFRTWSNYSVVQYLDHSSVNDFTSTNQDVDLALSTFLGERFFKPYHMFAFRRKFYIHNMPLVDNRIYRSHMEQACPSAYWLDMMLSTSNDGYLDAHSFCVKRNYCYAVFICPIENGGLDALFITGHHGTEAGNYRLLRAMRDQMPGVTEAERLAWLPVTHITPNYLTKSSVLIPDVQPLSPSLFVDAVVQLTRSLKDEFGSATRNFAVNSNNGGFIVNPYHIPTPVVEPLPSVTAIESNICVLPAIQPAQIVHPEPLSISSISSIEI